MLFFRKKDKGTKKNKNQELMIFSPVEGKVKDLTKLKDEVFSKKMVGDGIAIMPSSNDIYSPVNGSLKVAFPTGHAFGIATKIGLEILVHIGMDTVELKGKGFDSKVRQGEKVSPSSMLVNVDFDYVKAQKKAKDIVVIVTNETLSGWRIEPIASIGSDIKIGDELFKLIKEVEDES